MWTASPVTRAQALFWLLTASLLSGSPGPLRAQNVERWTLREELRIGSQGGPEALTRISSLLTDSLGKIYLVQPLEAAVRVYDSDGRSVATLGRRGDGPGEFRVPLHAGWIRDTLWVVDLADQRVTFWKQGIAPAGGFRFTGPDLGPDFNPAAPIAVLEDGNLLFGAVPRMNANGRRATNLGAALRAGRDGSEVQPVAKLRFSSLTVVESSEGSSLMLSYQPFDDRTLVRCSSRCYAPTPPPPGTPPTPRAAHR